MLYTFPPGRQCLQSLHHPPSLSSLWHLNSVAKVSLSQLPWNIIAWQHLVLKMTQKAGKSGSTPHSDHSGPRNDKDVKGWQLEGWGHSLLYHEHMRTRIGHRWPPKAMLYGEAAAA